MDHNAWENQILETFERREVEAAKAAAMAKPNQVISKTDAKTVAVGIKRTLLALLTILFVGAAVYGFVAVASARGYIAVLLFFASVLGLIASYILLYAQGITNVGPKESQGESK